MFPIEEIFRIAGEQEFEQAALATFRFQAEHCAPYREYLRLLGIDPRGIVRTAEIPFLPIAAFKSTEVYCGEAAPRVIFTSSTTTGATPSRHALADPALYERSFTEAFRTFYGDPRKWSIYGLLPNYLERQGSSLVYMVDRLIAACGSGGFFLHDYRGLIERMAADPKPKILIGVSYALWELAEQHAGKLERTVVMETGGMKGRREELPKEEFHAILCRAFGLEAIHSEYGMTELCAQAYSQGGNRFRTPAWMAVTARDVNDPFDHPLPPGVRGGLNVIDLANRYSCSFIQTEDMGRVYADGSFSVDGRIDRSDVRGCNLMIE